MAVVNGHPEPSLFAAIWLRPLPSVAYATTSRGPKGQMIPGMELAGGRVMP